MPVIAAMLFTTACGGSAAGVGDEGAGSTKPDAPLIEAVPAEYSAEDVSFVTNVTAQLRHGLQLSELVSERSPDPDIVVFAQKSADTMESQMGVARALQVQWTDGGGTGPGAGPVQPVDDAGQAAIATVEAASAQDFDNLWLQAALDHQHDTLDMANGEVAKGKNVDALGLARQMSTIAQASIDEINQLRNETGNG